MKITNWLDLLGGLALFLYGMQVLSDSLEDAAGDRLKTILEKLTNTKFKGVLYHEQCSPHQDHRYR